MRWQEQWREADHCEGGCVKADGPAPAQCFGQAWERESGQEDAERDTALFDAGDGAASAWFDALGDQCIGRWVTPALREAQDACRDDEHDHRL